MMYTPLMISFWLRETVCYQRIGAAYPELTGGIIFIGKDFAFDPSCLCIGTAASVCRVVREVDFGDSPAVLLCSGVSDELRKLEVPENVSLIACSLDLISLYNRVQTHIHAFLAWDGELRRAVFGNKDLRTLFDCAKSFMPVTMLLLNSGYRAIAAEFREYPCPRIIKELRENGYPSFESVKAMQRALSAEDAHGAAGRPAHAVIREGGSAMAIWPITHNNSIVAFFLVALPDEESELYYIDLGCVVSRYIETYMVGGRGADYNSTSAFGSLLADLIENRVSSSEELAERLKQVPLAFSNYYHLLLVTFARGEPNFGRNPPWNYIISQLQQVFPLSNISTYRGQIIILARKTKYSQNYQFDAAAAEAILRQYDCYLTVGNYSKFLTSVSSIYDQTAAAYRIASKLERFKGRRIFRFEETSIYYNLELAAAGMKYKNGGENYVYLCHPAYIALLRYDRQHNTDYCRVLKTYLMSKGNAAEAARELFLHRNTMLYKISRIEEILGETMDDPGFRFRLLYSCYVNEYVTEYLQEDILKLKRKRPEGLVPAVRAKS